MSAAKPSPVRLMQIIHAPLVSEKGTRVGEKFNQTIFKVARDATKPEIKAAVELMFKVHVEAVQVANQKGKVKRFARYVGRRKNWKKAFIRLKPGEEIQLGPAE